MAELRTLLAALGFEDVATSLNSGNAVFRAPATSPASLEAPIEAAIKARFGFEVRVAVREPADLERALAANPLPGALDDPTHYLIAFFVSPMPASIIAAFDPGVFHPEVVRLGDGVAYLWYREGIGRSKLTVDVLERRLGAVVTARNWNTVTKLLALAAR